jgi:flagellar biosynthesis/type III secretory pathway protein FliH
MQGKAEGKAEGKAQGKAEAVEQMRRMVLQRIEKRFGVVPEAVQVKVQAMNSLKALVSLVEKLPLAPSAEDLLSRRRSRSKISVS